MTTATSNPTAATEHGLRFARPGLIAALQAEWTKLVSIRSTFTVVGLGIILAIASSAGLSAAIGSSWDELNPAQQASFDTLPITFFGTLFTTIFFCVLGVSTVVSEYSSGMMRLTLSANPRRTRVLLAKVVIVAGVTLVAGLIAAFGSFLASQSIFDAYGMPARTLGDPDALRTTIVVGITSAVFPLMGVSLGFVLRSTASALTSIMAFVFVPGLFGPLLPLWWQENLLRYLPGSAIESLAMANTNSVQHLNAAPAAAVVVGWLILALAVAHTTFLRRDA